MAGEFGILVTDKPGAVTSREVVNQVQRIVRPAKCGHAGTLDPLATGILVVCLGPATRLIQFIQQLPKTYVGRFRLGVSSNTDDITGELTTLDDPPKVEREQLEAALPNFVGEIKQVPPQFSAVHVKGQRAYDLARQGVDFELESKCVTVYSIELLSFEWPDFELKIECGSGTYIRSIGRDLGEKLGCPAVMTELRRTAIGPFDEAVAVDPVQLSRDTISTSLLPPNLAVEHHPQFEAGEDDRQLIIQGKSIGIPAVQDLPRSRLKTADAKLVSVLGPDGSLWALAEFDETRKCLRPRHVFIKADR